MEDFPPIETEPGGHQGRLAAISREVVVLLKSLVGRGPTKSKAYIHDDCVVLLLREGHTRGEETMFEAGGSRRVAQGRVDISETIRGSLIEVIERHTGRKVVGFMSSSQQHPDLISFVFVLDTSPLLEVIEGDGGGSG
ncbi:MAG TPA: Na-translocating system protein MpsC family protein [Solirubrobacterales bacterium]|nr:Na-translocating system protein MpsC family protein [Solirubrobacterales bacterium]